MRAVQGGSESAFRELYDLLYDPLYRVCLRVLHDPILAHDAVQECFLRVYIKKHGCNPETAMAWIYAVTRNTAITFYREQQRSAARIDLLDPHDLEDLADSITDLTPESLDLVNTPVEAALRRLPLEQQELLHNRYYNDYSLKRIAQEYEWSMSATKMRLKRAREALRALLVAVLLSCIINL